MMTSFKEVQDMLLLSYDQGLINEEKCFMLYEKISSDNLVYLYKDYGKFNLQEKDSAEYKTEFRFEENDTPLLAEQLRIPEVFKCPQGTLCDGIEGLCILLKRFVIHVDTAT